MCARWRLNVQIFSFRKILRCLSMFSCKKHKCAKCRVDHLLFHPAVQKNVLAVEQKVKLSAEGREGKKKKFWRTSFLFWASGCSGFHGARVRERVIGATFWKTRCFIKRLTSGALGMMKMVVFFFSLNPFNKQINYPGWITEAGEQSGGCGGGGGGGLYNWHSTNVSDNAHWKKNYDVSSGCRSLHFQEEVQAGREWSLPGSGFFARWLHKWRANPGWWTQTDETLPSASISRSRCLSACDQSDTFLSIHGKWAEHLSCADVSRSNSAQLYYKGILSQMWLWRYGFLGQFSMQPETRLYFDTSLEQIKISISPPVPNSMKWQARQCPVILTRE